MNSDQSPCLFLSEKNPLHVFLAFAVIAIMVSKRRGFLMSTCATALLVIDVQESFRHRPYWRDCDVPCFVEYLQSLIDGAQSRKIPVIQIFHVEDSGPFSLESGYVVPLQDVSFTADAVFLAIDLGFGSKCF